MRLYSRKAFIVMLAITSSFGVTHAPDPEPSLMELHFNQWHSFFEGHIPERRNYMALKTWLEGQLQDSAAVSSDPDPAEVSMTTRERYADAKRTVRYLSSLHTQEEAVHHLPWIHTKLSYAHKQLLDIINGRSTRSITMSDLKRAYANMQAFEYAFNVFRHFHGLQTRAPPPSL